MKNILYIHTHDTGRVIGPYGYKTPTPELEAFAGEAAVFRNAFCAGPTCSPSRAAMLSGTYPHQNGMLGLAQRGFSMDYGRHLVNFLKDRGYETVLCGIQHEAGWYLDHGEGGAKIGYDKVLTRDGKDFRQEDLTDWDKENAMEVCRWLRNCGGERPFFLSYGMYATHRRFPDRVDEDIRSDCSRPPYPMPDCRETREDYGGFLMSLRSADSCFGQVIRCVKQLGLWDNTIVLFTTDHGPAFPFSKCTLYDSGTGVSLMIHVPGMDGRVIDGLASHVDVFPTLCELLGAEPPAYLEGVSLVPLLTGEREQVRDQVFSEINFHTSYEPARSVRTERYKYIRYYDRDYLKANRSNIDESRSKAFFERNGLENWEKPEEGLYDLLYDPGERNNLAGKAGYEALLEDMRDRLERWQEQTGDPLLKGPIPIDPAWKVNKRECKQASSRDASDYVSMGLGNQ